MKQKQFPFFEDAENHIDHSNDILAVIDRASPSNLLAMLTQKNVTTPQEERREWDEAYGYMEEGGHYHWISFEEYIHQQRSYYRDMVIRVRDGKAKNYQQAKEQMRQEGRENIRILMDQLRAGLKQTMDR